MVHSHNFKSQSSTEKSWKAVSVECIEQKRKTISSVEVFHNDTLAL
jgi:hypothetical protein